MISDLQLMANPQNFLCVESDTYSRLLLVRTLRRVFPQSTVVEMQDYAATVSLLSTQTFDVIVARRAIGADPVNLIRGLREAAKSVPILAIAGTDRAKELLAAGATHFLSSESWLLVGLTVAGILDDKCPAPA